MHHSCWLLWPHVFFSNAGITVTTQASSCLLPLSYLSVIHFVRWHSSYIYCILLPSQLAYVSVMRERYSFTKIIFLPYSLSYFSVFLQCIVGGGNTATSNASCLLRCCHLSIFQQCVVRGGISATFNASYFLQCELWETVTNASSCLLPFHMKQCSCLVEHGQSSFWQTIKMQE